MKNKNSFRKLRHIVLFEFIVVQGGGTQKRVIFLTF